MNVDLLYGRKRLDSATESGNPPPESKNPC